MSQPAAEMVRQPLGGQARKDLSFPGEAAKGARVQDSGGVTRKRGAVGVRWLRVDSAC